MVIVVVIYLQRKEIHEGKNGASPICPFPQSKKEITEERDTSYPQKHYI